MDAMRDPAFGGRPGTTPAPLNVLACSKRRTFDTGACSGGEARPSSGKVT